MSDVLDQLRHACATVAHRARHVRVNRRQIPAYAASLDPDQAALASGTADDTHLGAGNREERAAYWLTLDAINFGSGWFPTLRKPPGKSGYHTIAAGITRRFRADGPWTVDELQAITPQAVAEVLAQDPAHVLIELFARSLRDLGRQVAADYEGRFVAVVDAAGGSPPAIVAALAGWDAFTDTSTYDGLTIPFLKRAQIAAADLARGGVASRRDIGRLTMFADNLVPHVLRLDGILSFEPSLVDRIEREELIEHGSPEEVEIRACALHAVELIAAERSQLVAAEIDQLLWLRGQRPFYKASPRHRSRCTAY